MTAWATIGGTATLAVALTLGTVVPGPTVDLWPLALAMWCTVTLGAGIGLLVAARVSGWSRPGYLGAIILALALMYSVIPRISDVLAPIARLEDLRPLGTSAVLLVAVATIPRALRLEEVDSATSPVREVGRLLVLMLLCILAGTTVLLLAGEPLLDVAGFAPGAVCLAGAIICVLARSSAPGVIRFAFAVALGFMGIASLLHHATDGDLPQAMAAGLMVAAAWAFAGVAKGRLTVALAMHDARSLQTLATLGKFSTEASRDRERRHDALNALTAITTATEVLASHSERLDVATRADIARAAREELVRVERMLAPAEESIHADVALADILRPVLAARRLQGLMIDDNLADDRVDAAPDAVARIVSNLLQNVSRHAAGAGVRVSVDRADGFVHLNVMDDGPGIPAAERARVFDRGYTSHSAGQGLGLGSARRLAREQGGELSLVSAERGCWFVVTLPAAKPAAKPAATVTPLRARAG